MKILKKMGISLLLLCGIGLLSACSPPTTLDSPCDAFGQHCDPKIPINQWTP